MKALINGSFVSLLRHSKPIIIDGARTIKNFGHKPVPVPLVTTLWHGFLTFGFIGLVVEWNKIRTFMFGDSSEIVIDESIESNDKI